jgi:hypothetical protein
MADMPKRGNRPGRDDDVRGEHEYGGRRPNDNRQESKAQSEAARKRGHYAAGGDGTQDVQLPSGNDSETP